MVPSSTEPKPWTTTLRRFLAPSTLLLGLVNGCDSVPPRYKDSLWYISATPTCLLVACWFSQICIQGCRSIDRSANLEMEKIQNQGLHLYLEMQWTRLKVPTLLKSYGVLRIMLVVYQSWDSLTISLVGLNSDLELVLVRGCETYIALLSFTSLISVLSNFIGSIFKLFLDTDDVDDQSIGSISSILFFILALQTGLVDLEPDMRFIQIGKNCCLLLTAILHYIHSMVHPYISNLATRTGTAVSLNKKKHLRALSVCLFLILFPLGLTLILWSKFQLGTWLMAVTAFCAEVVVKILVTLTIYSVTIQLSLLCFQDVLWESFDDTIFYIKAFGGTAQFFFAIFVFLNGGWVLLFEAGGCFRAVMMVIHAYYNIWLEAKSGWSTFWKRRTALEKIADMQDATKEQIEKLADVCAICYQEMAEAKLTRCSHMFHYSCLTKWLHVQDSCPMCHETLRKVDATSQTEEPLPTPVIPAELLEDSEDHNDESTDDSELEDSEDDDLDDIQPFRPELGIYLPGP
ncbi:protein TRC8 homolog [Eurytemora carolleeae]|uniref:protein TRC8 homolog n=1 Tax=Eurytemora carolleeae TaxID=1294199 RepID=UPI000C7631FC|nr:protein TRC8 homolog [Eurytemora carolleeae]|eukprot:XP_023342029.1 protein TRC8 homolog [Eurytemora affinis]